MDDKNLTGLAGKVCHSEIRTIVEEIKKRFIDNDKLPSLYRPFEKGNQFLPSDEISRRVIGIAEDNAISIFDLTCYSSQIRLKRFICFQISIYNLCPGRPGSPFVFTESRNGK